MSNRFLGMYDHLNNDSKLEVSLSIEDLAKRLEDMNYGTHRLLSALVKYRREREDINANRECRMLTDGIEDLLNKGGF